MRERWLRIVITCSLPAGLSDLWIGATSTLPSSWIRVVTGGIMLLTSAGWLYVWAKSRA